MDSTLIQLGHSIQLSAQVSESLAFDLRLLAFIQSCLHRHSVGDFQGLSGLALEHAQECAAAGLSIRSTYLFTAPGSIFHGMHLQLLSPSARDTTFISFLGEQ